MRTITAILSLAALVASPYSQAQSGFQLNGRLKIEGGSTDGARVVVYKEGKQDRTLERGVNKFTMDLDFNANYVLSFEKEGYVTKKLVFNTQAPAEAVANGFAPFEFAVSLFKQYDDVNTVVFNQPVGIIRYESSVDDFDYDTDYTRSIQSALELAQQQTEEKAKEEGKKEKEEAKRAEQERKEAEKAAAEAAKLADAQAREEEKRAEQAQKAEQERLAQLAAQEEQKAPEPIPVIQKEDPPPPPSPRPVQRNLLMAEVREGADDRRGSSAVEGSDRSPVRPAQPMALEEERPEQIEAEVEVVRQEELIVEKNQVITVIRLESELDSVEFKRIAHKWGGVFYFKNGAAISQQIYESEALADR
ncbi:MAG: hypothetical protein KDB88_08410 [Flavobacteriales bacterium]|nr:hypothetical protein [Flavobacteriales bacterium]